ncbi:DUF3068 domain-containing protein [Sphaerisporangium aureirubrum]|uniref:DUF3068 domain-containing protein n=1 Tax=Sphaerisporangium aureirubrum TaxID=1544736 RepID=A0ABW1NQF0_9ACTN
MRRGVGPVLILLGAFLLSGAALVRFYVAERVLGARPDAYQVVETEARDATYFDPGSASVRTGLLRGTTTVRGDVGAGGPTWVVWDAFTELAAEDGTPVSYTQERAAFDRRTGTAVACCGESAAGRPAPHSGLVFRWPYGTPPRDQSLWDVTTRRSYPARFAGTDTVSGTAVYRFVADTPPTAVATRGLPPRLLGLPGTRDVPVTLWAQATRTYWIEPITGTPLRTEERIHQAYRTPDGRERLIVLNATLNYTPTQTAKNTATARTEITRIHTLTTTIPLIALTTGTLALLAGALTALLTRHPPPRAHERPTPN